MTTTEVIASDRREEKGKMIATERQIYRIIGKDVFYVESQTLDGVVYFIIYNTEKGFEWCSCNDFTLRRMKCKHLFAVEYGIRKGTIKDTEKLPKLIKREDEIVKKVGWKEDEYDF